VAVVHVYSEERGIAALGNITTRPDRRGSCLGKRLPPSYAGGLLKNKTVIGLKVKANNLPAMACYNKLGFEVEGEYEEWAFEGKL
jgi:ribosomal protein S18 acetylase RimI-like enzyme